jgi:hypothetical protein
MISVEIRESWTIQDLMNRVAIIEENLFRTKLGGDQLRRGTPAEDSMDWTPTTSRAHLGRTEKSSTDRKKAKWATKEERSYYRQNNLCLRCGKSGHYANKCSLSSPLKPPIKAAAATPVSD